MKSKGKMSKEEAKAKLHQVQMQSLDGEIQNMIQSKILESPRYSGNSSASSTKCKRPTKLDIAKKKKTGRVGSKNETPRGMQ